MQNSVQQKNLVVAITGATGIHFATAFLEVIADAGITVHGICSDAGRKVMRMELGVQPEDLETVDHWFAEGDFAAAPASGSAGYDGMAIIPCTMGTLGAIAGGVTNNLIQRAADVMLKERKPLVLVVRETPLNRTHLKNMLAVHDAGAVICPPLPSYYLQPKSLKEAAEMFGWRLADQFGITIEGRKRWGDPELS